MSYNDDEEIEIGFSAGIDEEDLDMPEGVKDDFGGLDDDPEDSYH